MKDNKFKILVLIALVLYTLGPDPIPGPIDDAILWIVYMMSSKKSIEEEI